MAACAALVLLASGIIARWLPGESLSMMILSLTLLGLGWNLSLISRTTILVGSTEPSIRARAQGSVDALIALSGAAGGALSGMVVARASFGFLSTAGGVLALFLLPTLAWARKGRK